MRLMSVENLAVNMPSNKNGISRYVCMINRFVSSFSGQISSSDDEPGVKELFDLMCMQPTIIYGGYLRVKQIDNRLQRDNIKITIIVTFL